MTDGGSHPLLLLVAGAGGQPDGLRLPEVIIVRSPGLGAAAAGAGGALGPGPVQCRYYR